LARMTTTQQDGSQQVDTRRYDLVAIDIDGTLIDHTGQVHARNIAAIARARAEGMTVVLCTGRALIECRRVIETTGQCDPVIVSGGAIIADPVTERTIERQTMPPGLVARLCEYLHQRSHPALLLKDSDAAGFDYLVVSPRGEDALDPASRWWFDHMGVRCRFAQAAADDEHPEHTVRVGAYSANTPVVDLAEELARMFHAEVMLQHFNGVLLPKERRDQGIESIHIVEVFNPLADKWQALCRLAARLNIPQARLCAIGDQTNDQTMVGNAALGIAMGNAHPAVAAVAKRQTLAASEGGVGYALEHVLRGEW